MTNPTMMYTMFSVFVEDSPQQVRRNMVQWINDNKQKFESQTLLAFTAKDSELDTWLSNINSNSTPGDEFTLFALCQMYTRHALIVTSNQTWTSVHPKHGLDDHDLRRKCDRHLIYLGGDAFGILKPKFEWKVDVPVGHIEMVEPLDKPLQDTTTETLSKEASADNILEIKEEPVDTNVQVLTELQDITAQTPSEDLPNATTNLIVALPPDMQLNLDNKPQHQKAVEEAVTRPCSVKLFRCDIVVPKPLPKVVNTPIEVNVVVKHPNYDLRAKGTPKGNKATSTIRSHHSISQNVSYVEMFQESSSDDTANEVTVQPLGAAIKQEPSHYRLVAHKYMLASRRGIISGPKVHTCASTVPKRETPTNEDTDSDATVILEEDIKPTVPIKRKTTGLNKKPKKKTKQKTFVTKTYILRKGGSAIKPKKKRRKPYLFKCLIRALRWPTCKERNDHFKQKHRKLQCKKCKKFFHTPSAFTLHQYIHKDGQFECNVCKAFFPFKSQLNHHMVSNSETREYKCQEPFCEKDFTHKSDLVKHKHTHSGVMYKCSKCNYSNSDERNYNQHLRKHTNKTQFQCKQCN